MTPKLHLIVGDTSDATARIWVRSASSCTCYVSIWTLSPRSDVTRQVCLSSATDYAGTIDFTNLNPDTEYSVEARYTSRLGKQHVAPGRFHTFPRSTAGGPPSFSFVLSSCNLSVVSINNLLALLVAVTGVHAAQRSLIELPLGRWKYPKLIWLWAPLRYLIWVVLTLVAWFVKKTTKAKQPSPPYLRSPFLKLSAVFESQVLEIVIEAGQLPGVGDEISMVGDGISGRSGAKGVVAAAASAIEPRAKEASRDEKESQSVWRLVVTHVEGTFVADRDVLKRDAVRIGTIRKVSPGRRWYERPSFFIHAGDQIYYDFPFEDREPAKNEYRLAYREAWFDDVSNRYLLSHWPHYMTLDDHEFADQFARDFNPPMKKSHPAFWIQRQETPEERADKYYREAAAAYREYVHSRNPSRNGCCERRDEASAESFWYRFDKGDARFFVLDTRTQRFDCDPSQMIDENQMNELLKWMSEPEYKHDLKFVVTSVPFVAEIHESPKDPTPKWIHQDRKNPSVAQQDSGRADENSANDKWSAPRFERQRNRIIEHIASEGIEHLVFLTGDTHCCYHASMRIGDGSKYESITIHELAGGPVNQLQLANLTEFHPRRSGRTPAGIEYEVVLDRFHGEVNAVMHMKVSYEKVSDYSPSTIFKDAREFVPRVDWQVIRTLTDEGAAAWVDDTTSSSTQAPETTMAGRITFIRKRSPGELRPWPCKTV